MIRVLLPFYMGAADKKEIKKMSTSSHALSCHDCRRGVESKYESLPLQLKVKLVKVLLIEQKVC